jgi:hypothetical protein
MMIGRWWNNAWILYRKVGQLVTRQVLPDKMWLGLKEGINDE